MGRSVQASVTDWLQAFSPQAMELKQQVPGSGLPLGSSWWLAS